ncbi:protoglobin domain-containing protein [Acetobacter okinawensis]|uniref:protoglobin domain-containing protein n=1 Tax=Acetobacter okinawensis TaxID=1076594 RepID=UPI0009DCA2E3|nr:protoglobin domain-containing protein [Acetobacter okinawensis]
MERDDHSVMSIRHRHDFIGMNEDDFNAIKGLRNTLVNALPDALDALYEKIRKTPELKRFFFV